MDSPLSRIFLQQRDSLIARATRILRDRTDAEDVAQDTWLRASRAESEGVIDRPEAFLHRTARNLAIDRMRSAGLRQGDPAAAAELPADIPSVEDRMIQRERIRLLERALSHLPDRARQVWILNRVGKWPYPRIAAHLGVSPNTVFNDMKLAMSHCLEAMKRIDSE